MHQDLNSEYTPVTCLNSLTLIILKELRAEQGLLQAVVADKLGMTGSAWSKIESGKNSLAVDLLFNVCRVLNASPAVVLASVERHFAILSGSGWCILSNSVPEKDSLLHFSEQFYNLATTRNRMHFPFRNVGVLQSPVPGPYGAYVLSDLFQFVRDEGSKMQEPIYAELKSKLAEVISANFATTKTLI